MLKKMQKTNFLAVHIDKTEINILEKEWEKCFFSVLR